MSKSHWRHPGVIVDAPVCSLWIFSDRQKLMFLTSFGRACVCVRAWSILVAAGLSWSLLVAQVALGCAWSALVSECSFRAVVLRLISSCHLHRKLFYEFPRR